MDARVSRPLPVDKAGWRREMRLRLADLPPEAREREHAALGARLADEVRLFGPEWLLATLPFQDEPDLTSFLRSWLALGVRVALARVGPDRRMTFHEVAALSGGWDTHRWGMDEPSAQLPEWTGGRALCLVPGLAFAPFEGRVARLGRGGGFFDRWLASHEVRSLAVGYSVQSVAELPREPHDKTLDGALFPL